MLFFRATLLVNLSQVGAATRHVGYGISRHSGWYIIWSAMVSKGAVSHSLTHPCHGSFDFRVLEKNDWRQVCFHNSTTQLVTY